ncbi:MAG: hypothetical protein US60_C0001G0051 [Microgenomates group bacterium GW2011_GWC1_37_8]|uniref:Glycosyl transferase group 1 n=1 Tax=Candidatus Woesebacteria bacterium GW2011_GWB1_38_8 TaxID=1618570 RepID=A0A0G0NK35_9BACT|nr:MAG: hypothetical protein US60_C0001G0051 [Microgenomates group bacterium GW2011_GWC1_37_8]KKQ86254.1 MAG: hypothetical protein UT08_C0001G0120 [Candidatus Woesebacteria bacterium GW2011_GWB1_38_8]
MNMIFSSYDEPNNPYYAGGGARAVFEIARRFAKNNKVMFICGNYKNAKDTKVEGVLYKHIGPKFMGAKLGQLAFHLYLPLSVLREEYDIWIESFTPPISVSFLPLFTKKPVVGLCHMLAGTDMKRKYKLPFDLIERIGLKIYKYIIVVNQITYETIARSNKNSFINLIPNGVLMPGEIKTKSKSHILFVGRIEVNQKGLDLLLSAYALLATETKLKLVIVGSGTKSEEKNLINLIKKLGMDKKVEVLGRVEGKQKDELFRKAYLVVIPSRYETFSLVALETMSYGLPLVCFDINGLAWIPKNIAYKVDAFNVHKLNKAILEVLNDNRLRIKLGKSARKFAEKYNWVKIFKSYANYINQVVNVEMGLDNQQSFDPFVERIIKNKTRCIFISPHLDDAILSAGGLISYLSGKVPIEVINVFTNASRPITLSGRAIIKKSGFKDLESFYSARRQEDDKVLTRLDIKKTNLKLVDALFRKKILGKKRNIELLGKIFPEVLHIYPTYRLHVISGYISKQDVGTVKIIKKRLVKTVSSTRNTLIFCPIGNGGHVDHLIVRDACSNLFKNLVYWRDFPYVTKNAEFLKFKVNHKLEQYIFNKNTKKKKELIVGYKSQTELLSRVKGYEDPKEFYYSVFN